MSKHFQRTFVNVSFAVRLNMGVIAQKNRLNSKEPSH